MAQKYRPRVQNMNYAMLFIAVGLLSDHRSIDGLITAAISLFMAATWMISALLFLEKAE